MGEDPAKLDVRLANVEKILNGNGKLGLVGRVEILWRSWVWLLCALTFCLGSLVTALIQKFAG